MSWLGSNDNEEVLHIPLISKVLASKSDGLMSYAGRSLGVIYVDILRIACCLSLYIYIYIYILGPWISYSWFFIDQWEICYSKFYKSLATTFYLFLAAFEFHIGKMTRL